MKNDRPLSFFFLDNFGFVFVCDFGGCLGFFSFLNIFLLLLLLAINENGDGKNGNGSQVGGLVTLDRKNKSNVHYLVSSWISL